MKHEKLNPKKVDTSADATKTSPRGMAPDKAHAASKSSGGTTLDVEVEETFDNSPNNAGATGNRKLK